MSARRASPARCPNLLDLLTVTVEAGLGLDSALAKIASKIHGPLHEEILITLHHMRMGRESGERLARTGAALWSRRPQHLHHRPDPIAAPGRQLGRVCACNRTRCGWHAGSASRTRAEGAGSRWCSRCCSAFFLHCSWSSWGQPPSALPRLDRVVSPDQSATSRLWRGAVHQAEGATGALRLSTAPYLALIIFMIYCHGDLGPSGAGGAHR